MMRPWMHFRKMIRTGEGRLPVVKDGKAVGMVTRRDILNLLEIKTDLGEGLRTEPCIMKRCRLLQWRKRDPRTPSPLGCSKKVR